jgi:DNA-binding CsgD family transcriptional regulator
MPARAIEAHRRLHEADGTEVLDELARSETPALAADVDGRIVFWNRAAERLLGRVGSQLLGHRCHDVLGGRDEFGNRYCHENCSVLTMSRRGESVHGFELTLANAPRPDQAVGVSILRVPGARGERPALVHILQPIDRNGRLARALERLGVRGGGNGTATVGGRPPATPGPVTTARAAPLTEREQEILRWVAAGLQNKEIAPRLGISLATVRNHIHSVLEKLDVHSKLEAASLAFRKGWVSGSDGDDREPPLAGRA